MLRKINTDFSFTISGVDINKIFLSKNRFYFRMESYSGKYNLPYTDFNYVDIDQLGKDIPIFSINKVGNMLHINANNIYISTKPESKARTADYIGCIAGTKGDGDMWLILNVHMLTDMAYELTGYDNIKQIMNNIYKPYTKSFGRAWFMSNVVNTVKPIAIDLPVTYLDIVSIPPEADETSYVTGNVCFGMYDTYVSNNAIYVINEHEANYQLSSLKIGFDISILLTDEKKLLNLKHMHSSPKIFKLNYIFYGGELYYA